MNTDSYNHIIKTLLALLLLSSTHTAWSAREYNIELIIFRYTGVEQYSAEHWPDNWKIPDTRNSLDLIKLPWAQKDQIRKLAPALQTLNNIAAALEKSERYQVLTHLAWQQPGFDKNDAINIKIEAGQVYHRLTPYVPSVGDQSEPDAPQLGGLFVTQENLRTGSSLSPEMNKMVPVEYQPVELTARLDPDRLVYELSGNIKIVISRFVHVYSDLLLMQPVILKVEQPADNQGNYSALDGVTLVEKPKYRLIFSSPDLSFTTLHGINVQEHRRMRSDELNFIDHPLLGIIVKAWSVP